MRSTCASRLALVAALALIAAGCGERPRTNPLDPNNPETGGGPQDFRALASSSMVGLRWRSAPAEADLLGFRLERRLAGTDPFLPIDSLFSPRASSYDDAGVTDDVEYEYRLTFVARDSATTGTPVLARARPGREVVWVADPGFDEVVRLTPDGRNRIATISNVLRVNRLGIDVTDGAVWATEPFDGRVRVFTVNGGPLSNFLIDGSPNAIAVDPVSGSAWIADEGTGAVLRMDRQGAPLASAGLFLNPQDLALVPGGGAWVIDAQAGVVQRIDASGAHGPVAAPGGDPRRAAVDALDGSVWVTRFAAGEVMKFSADGEILARTALSPGPYAVDIDEARNLVWVGLDTGNAIVALDRGSGGEVRRVEGIERPRGIAVADRTGEVWVAAIAAGEVVRIASDGTVLGRTGGFTAPFDVRIDPGPRPLP